MKRAFSLIELIFTIIIMAGIFAVIPKVIFATNKSDTFAIKQDALLNAISLTRIAQTLSWDENNTANADILTVQSATAPCDPNTYIRIGGFLSANGRVCKEPLFASSIMSDASEDDYLKYDDIDDFKDTTVHAMLKDGSNKYAIESNVTYLADSVFSVNAQVLTITLDPTPSALTTQIKKFRAVARYEGKRGKAQEIGGFYVYSANIGQFTLGSQAW